jgi:hypothetical protein
MKKALFIIGLLVLAVMAMTYGEWTRPIGGTSVSGNGTASATVTINIMGNTSEELFDAVNGTGDLYVPGYVKAQWYATMGILIEDDFLYSAADAPTAFYGVALTGTSGTVAGTPEHIGITRIRGTTTTNTGYQWRTDSAITYLGSNMCALAIIRPYMFNATVQRTLTFFGFHDLTTAVNNPTDGCYFCINNSQLDVRCRSNNVMTVSNKGYYGMKLNTWYSLEVCTTAAAATAEFKVFNDAGTLLWNSTISGNIPNVAAREVGVGIISTMNGTIQNYLIDVDYLAFARKDTMVRRPINT